MKKQNMASTWRIKFAKKLVRQYSCRPGIKMILLGGSPSRGISDEFSDLDIVLYWDRLDAKFIESRPLAALGGDFKTLLDMRKEGEMLEIYNFGNLIVECGHTTLDAWKTLVKDVNKEGQPNPMKINSIGGFLDAKALHGAGLHRRLKTAADRYPDELARRVVRQNLGFFWKGTLVNQGLRRGELVYFYDGITGTLKRLLNVLAALNRMYAYFVEPRWIDYKTAKMRICPKNTWKRIRRIYDGPRMEAIPALEKLVGEVLELVAKHMPEADLTKVRQCERLEIRAAKDAPKLNL